jgi:predicted SnoaL-like aldol condensation-catalyzing enzyme
MNRSERIKSLIDEAGSGYVSVTFIKKDGKERQMTFNPMDKNDIKGTGDTSNVDSNIFRVRDNKIQEWRSFDARRVIKIKSRGVITEFND